MTSSFSSFLNFFHFFFFSFFFFIVVVVARFFIISLLNSVSTLIRSTSRMFSSCWFSALKKRNRFFAVFVLFFDWIKRSRRRFIFVFATFVRWWVMWLMTLIMSRIQCHCLIFFRTRTTRRSNLSTTMNRISSSSSIKSWSIIWSKIRIVFFSMSRKRRNICFFINLCLRAFDEMFYENASISFMMLITTMLARFHFANALSHFNANQARFFFSSYHKCQHNRALDLKILYDSKI